MSQIGVLCDMDGTLVDSEPYWAEAKFRLTEVYGIAFSQTQVDALVGRSMAVTVEALQDAGVPLDDHAIMNALLNEVAERFRQHGIPWIPGAQAFLARLKAARIPAILVTQAYPIVAGQVVDQSDGALVGLVSAADVSNVKPHPEPYLNAAEKVGLPVRDCVAIEDTPSGVASARAAGLPVVVVPGVHEVQIKVGMYSVESLEEVSVAMLRKIVAASGEA